MRIGRWSEHRFFLVCQLVEVIIEADANETSGNLEWHCTAILLENPSLEYRKLEPDTMLSNIVPLVSVELEYHNEW